jgi:hypothetical protein
MFEYGTIYGILLLMMYAASVMDIIFIIANIFFRREYRANYARYGISIFRILFSTALMAYAIFVLAANFNLTPTMRTIHFIAAILLGTDLIMSISYKLWFYIRSKKFGNEADIDKKK